ncbi:hypothetical protein GZH46_02666, partial [Fragariocoptes setiger]
MQMTMMIQTITACAIRLIVPPNYRISAKIFSRRLEFAQYLDQVPELGVSQLWSNEQIVDRLMDSFNIEAEAKDYDKTKTPQS